MSKDDSACSNKLTDWRKKDALTECTEECNTKGSAIAVYRAEKKLCRCCDDPPKLHVKHGSTVYKFKRGIILIIAISGKN